MLKFFQFVFLKGVRTERFYYVNGGNLLLTDRQRSLPIQPSSSFPGLVSVIGRPKPSVARLPAGSLQPAELTPEA
ncbi:jg11468 [Pararge aegeria aegeria]|uniref:Jg11468 protein n=1 Tax=Pararge aegeria aegeria TaxID=348720 RepID=A0A8S4RDI5_9NEOP|nr:jg11468 [Pararge aegeria aegeria]